MKSHKKSHNTPVVLCWHEKKNLKAIRGNGYRFFPRGGTFPTETIMLVVRSIYPNLPKMGQKIYHGMLIPLHDSMPSFMNFKRNLDLLEFNNHVSQYFTGNQRCPGVWNSLPFLAWDLSMHQAHIFDFSTNLYALEHVYVVQILIMHINALKNPVNA